MAVGAAAMLGALQGLCQGLVRYKAAIVLAAAGIPLWLEALAAGYGVGFAPLLRSAAYGIPDVVTRQHSMRTSLMTTYLLRKAGDSLPETFSAFIDRAIRELGEDEYGGTAHAAARYRATLSGCGFSCIFYGNKHRDCKITHPRLRLFIPSFVRHAFHLVQSFLQ